MDDQPNAPGIEVNNKSRLLLILGIVLVVLLLAVEIIYAAKHNSAKAETASQIISEFDVAMQTGNASKVLALESPWLQSYTRKETVSVHGQYPNVPITSNYYTLCKGVGQLCTYNFSAKVLSSATIKTSSYKASNGTVGVQETFTTVIKSNTSDSTSSSTIVSSVDAVPSGDTWLIDNFGNGSDSANVNI